MVDPETGNEYNLGLELVRDTEVKDRLVKCDENLAYIKNSFNLWEHNLTHLEDHFQDQLVILNVQEEKLADTTKSLVNIVFEKHLIPTE